MKKIKNIATEIWYDLLLILKPTQAVTLVERLKNKDVILDVGRTLLSKEQQCQVYQHIWSTFSFSISQHNIKRTHYSCLGIIPFLYSLAQLFCF